MYFFLLAKVDVGGRLVQADPEAFKLVLQQIMQSGRPKQEKLPTHLENLLVLQGLQDVQNHENEIARARNCATKEV